MRCVRPRHPYIESLLTLRLPVHMTHSGMVLCIDAGHMVNPGEMRDEGGKERGREGEEFDREKMRERVCVCGGEGRREEGSEEKE